MACASSALRNEDLNGLTICRNSSLTDASGLSEHEGSGNELPVSSLVWPMGYKHIDYLSILIHEIVQLWEGVSS